MLTSARNRFEGRVTKVISGAVNDEVVVRLATGEEIVSIVTRESTQKLGLREGRDVLALVKASFVILLADADDYLFSTRNVFPCTVTEVRKGQVAAEIDMETESGLSLTSTITVVSAGKMNLARGSKVSCAIKAPHVILAVKK